MKAKLVNLEFERVVINENDDIDILTIHKLFDLVKLKKYIKPIILF